MHADSRKVFVGGLPATITEADFRSYFSRYGTLVDCVVMVDRETGRSRGFGFITYDTESGADLVLTEKHMLHGTYSHPRISLFPRFLLLTVSFLVRLQVRLWTASGPSPRSSTSLPQAPLAPQWLSVRVGPHRPLWALHAQQPSLGAAVCLRLALLARLALQVLPLPLQLALVVPVWAWAMVAARQACTSCQAWPMQSAPGAPHPPVALAQQLVPLTQAMRACLGSQAQGLRPTLGTTPRPKAPPSKGTGRSSGRQGGNSSSLLSAWVS